MSEQSNADPGVRVLFIVASPSDLPRFDEAAVWSDVEHSLTALSASGRVSYARVEPATEPVLRQALAAAPWDVVHFIAHTAERDAARYAQLALLGSDGRARSVTGSYLAKLLVGKAPALVIFQASIPTSSRSGVLPDAMAEAGLPAISLPALDRQQTRAVIAKVAAGVLEGLSPEQLEHELAALQAPNRLRVRLSAPPDKRKLPVKRLALRATHVEALPAPPPATVVRTRSTAADELERKRHAAAFDVFLCHNSADKTAVKRIGQRLMDVGILPWLDEWELPPGLPWQPLLEEQLGSIRTAAVFVGSGDLGPWQQQEIYGLLREFTRRRVPVVPVVLPSASRTPALPLFLNGMTWVDFRLVDPDPFDRLVWGITGKRPQTLR